MKEHAFFLEIGFSKKDKGLIQQANEFQKRFGKILIETISLSSGVVASNILESGEVITPFTLKSEMSSAYFTGVGINTNITQAEIGLRGGSGEVSSLDLEKKIKVLNINTISLLMNFVNFKDKVLSDILSCCIFTRNYPSLLEHIIEEARFYLTLLQKIEKHEKIMLAQQSYIVQNFWDHMMEGHATIISILLDPSEKQLMSGAKSFEKEFKELSRELKENKERSFKKVTCQTIIVTREIQDFKRKITQGILECDIKSVMIPLLADHVLREANHYLRILGDI